MADTASTLDFDAHINLIFKDVSVFGVPGFDVIGHDGTINTNGIEFIIKKQDDGFWRVSQERLLPAMNLRMTYGVARFECPMASTVRVWWVNA